VHHAINKEYIDKNLAAIFCVWDRAFGTFQEELNDVPPVYGVLKPASTWNPILINFQHLWRLIKDAWRTKNWLDKLRIWFMPTGWRPKDVVEKYPIEIIKDPYNFKKYKTPASKALIHWSEYQLITTTLLMLFMFYNYANIAFNDLLIYGFILFIGIYGYSSLMDQKKFAVYIEVFRSLFALIILYQFKDWFGLSEYLNYGNYIVGIYYISCAIGALYFSFYEKPATQKIKSPI
jgi:hypothetical protein